MTCRITIVTPSYNQAEFIGDTLNSVAQQTHSDINHLVMDGESTDETIEILREHETASEDYDNYEFNWTSEPDEGQSDAINKGFERADGEVVAWLNSDDAYFDVDVLSRVAGYFEQFNADIVYGDLAYLDQHSTVTEIDTRPDFDRTKLPYRILIGQPATFFDREVVETEQLDASLDYSMDYEYWLRLAERFDFRHVPDVLAGFRTYETQKSQDQSAMAAELQNILTEYQTGRTSASVVIDNVGTEFGRLVRAGRVTYGMQRNPPELAFDGKFDPLRTMLSNIGPGIGDVTKAWRRWRSGGASG